MSSNSKKILLTGFGPFPGVSQNATQTYVPELAKRTWQCMRAPKFEIVDLILPAEWQSAPARAAEMIATINPQLILHFGVSKDARGFVIERMARNSCSVSPDACGDLPKDKCLEPHGPHNLFATIPAQKIVHTLRLLGYPAQLSRDAGDYICNATFYSTLKTKVDSNANRAIGFIHLPTDLGTRECELTWDDALRGGIKLIEICLANTLTHSETAIGPNHALSSQG